ncbi:MAG: metallophosphoesterase [Deltaproteobacteria bacterium]|nr:metallophosphoesterase [Deltaproteobacteria bacterium]
MRTIIIGDVHGCGWELAALLDRLGPTADDELLLVGDLVVRGPEPRRVLQLVREAGARAVRGNHEDRLLRWQAARQAQAEGGEQALEPSEARLLRAKWLTRTADQLEDEDWALIRDLPLWLDARGGQLRVVHGGLLPGVPMEEQAERTLLYLRTVDPLGRPSDLRDGGLPWGARYQGPPHVVFGHNADPEPQLHPWATGIDTGCVYGGCLTALVLPLGEPIPEPDGRGAALVQVAARRAHYPID